MGIESIKENVKKIIEDVLETDYSIDDFFNLELINLNINSVAYIKLLVKLETEFDVTFPEEIILINKRIIINDFVEFIVNNKNNITRTGSNAY